MSTHQAGFVLRPSRQRREDTEIPYGRQYFLVARRRFGVDSCARWYRLQNQDKLLTLTLRGDLDRVLADCDRCLLSLRVKRGCASAPHDCFARQYASSAVERPEVATITRASSIASEVPHGPHRRHRALGCQALAEHGHTSGHRRVRRAVQAFACALSATIK